MNVRQLRAELETLPDHLEIRLAMRTVYFVDQYGEIEIQVAQEVEAQALERVKFEGNFVGLYS